MPKVRVLIVEDSPVVRELLAHIISEDPRLEVAGAVATAEEALRVLPQTSPDVISMDIRLPGMDGLEATRRIMAEHPTPIVVVSAAVQSLELNITMNALRAGALSVVEKPVGTSHADYAAVAGRLCTQLAIMSEVRVVRQRGNAPAAVPAWARSPSSAVKTGGAPGAALAGPQGQYRMVGIAASTGGPSALTQLLRGLGADFPLPILLVQHITPSFLEGFVTWLDGLVPLQVRIAAEGEKPLPGRVYLSPVDRHLRLEGSSLRLDAGPPVQLQRPSGTVLFDSMGESLRGHGLGVLLTGMGEDGAEGLTHMRAAGAYTVAEDETTAVVYGMPGAAARMGGVCELLPLPQIAPRLRVLAGLNPDPEPDATRGND